VTPVTADAFWVLEAVLGAPLGLPLFPPPLAPPLEALEPPLEAVLDAGTAEPPPIAVIWLPSRITPS